MPTNLPTELLRSFVAIVDSGSMLRATERVFVTQSALSLQMKRLEETVLTPLFHREGRRLSLTPAGQTLLGHARDILALNDRAVVALTGDALAGPARVGLVQDFAETLLSGVLARFAQLNPDTQLQVRVAGSPELLELLRSDRLDVILCMGAYDDPAAARTVPMVWHGEPDLTQLPVLPLAILESPCRFRDAALAALEREGRSYRVALETPSLSALRAAVQSGLAVTCRTSLFRPDAQPIADGALPSLPKVAYVRRTGTAPHPSIAKLSELIHTAALEL
ncbi:LysR substrate-binding domain-containing protein [Caulobacter hibisci]|uniref:LysR family transcriptional regulator n=1 Tax=Caulobacter hibisci TaxID=2035993 RepID=A0ABS0STA1_9CAUL|nr:LysR substrate-binding domain-containing protein [Caulobacter hibisci]MBI1682796.1 LysR family transcriptional regulator [Caulobacter hibisci]